MARPREFDTDKAVSGAMDVFWEHGYEGASLPDLLKGMGITRGSLYKAFTDKKTLFLTVMARYEEQAVAPAITLLTDETITDGHARIEQLFSGVIEGVRNGDRRGCILCSAAAGPASEDTEIAQTVQSLLDRMRDGFKIAIGDSAHLRDAAIDHTEMANMLIAQYVGLRILARSHAPIGGLEQGVSSLMRLLK